MPAHACPSLHTLPAQGIDHRNLTYRTAPLREHYPEAGPGCRPRHRSLSPPLFASSMLFASCLFLPAILGPPGSGRASPWCLLNARRRTPLKGLRRLRAFPLGHQRFRLFTRRRPTLRCRRGRGARARCLESPDADKIVGCGGGSLAGSPGKGVGSLEAISQLLVEGQHQRLDLRQRASERAKETRSWGCDAGDRHQVAKLCKLHELDQALDAREDARHTMRQVGVSKAHASRAMERLHTSSGGQRRRGKTSTCTHFCRGRVRELIAGELMYADPRSRAFGPPARRPRTRHPASIHRPPRRQEVA
jgi:hypothetical protein